MEGFDFGKHTKRKVRVPGSTMHENPPLLPPLPEGTSFSVSAGVLENPKPQGL